MSGLTPDQLQAVMQIVLAFTVPPSVAAAAWALFR